MSSSPLLREQGVNGPYNLVSPFYVSSDENQTLPRTISVVLFLSLFAGNGNSLMRKVDSHSPDKFASIDLPSERGELFEMFEY